MNATRAGEIRRYATLHSIGVEWDIQGDANHNAACTVEYRRAGHADWSAAMPLLRIDYQGYYGSAKADRHYNMLAGSIFFLKPGARYEVRLNLKDADGGDKTEQFAIETLPVPSLPTGGRTFHVVPRGEAADAAVGTGTQADPFRGLAAAEEQAQPGDIFLLAPGDYGRFSPKKSGEPGRPIVWKAEGDKPADIHHLNIHASYLWIEGFNITRIAEAAWCGVYDRVGARDIVFQRNRLEGYHYGVQLAGGATGWYIADNIIIGDKDRPTGKGYDKPTAGEGIELQHTSNHVVCYNTISKTADGVSYPGRNCDIYGNDIFNVSDDALEPDSGYANVRMWGNRLHSHLEAYSFQPMMCGPWYIIRNQSLSSNVFKMRVCDRFVMINNTFVTAKSGCGFAFNLLKCFSRNNIWCDASATDYVWMAHVRSEKELKTLRGVVNYPETDEGFRPGWMTDLDYDAFGKQPQPPGRSMGDVFGWWDSGTKKMMRFSTVKDFHKFLGVEEHGLDIGAEETFQTWDIPDDLWRPYPKGEIGPRLFTLKPTARVVDAGVVLPNIHDFGYNGKAPDLGAHEFGVPPPYYGVRDAKAAKEGVLYWVLEKEKAP